MTFQKAKISKSQQLNKELQMRKTIIVVRNYQYIWEFPSEIPPNSHPQSVKFKPSPMGKYSPNPVVVWGLTERPKKTPKQWSAWLHIGPALAQSKTYLNLAYTSNNQGRVQCPS